MKKLHKVIESTHKCHSVYGLRVMYLVNITRGTKKHFKLFQELKRSDLQMIGVYVHGLAEFLGEFIFLTVRH